MSFVSQALRVGEIEPAKKDYFVQLYGLLSICKLEKVDLVQDNEALGCFLRFEASA